MLNITEEQISELKNILIQMNILQMIILTAYLWR